MKKIDLLLALSLLGVSHDAKPWFGRGPKTKFNLAECEACKDLMSVLGSETLNAKLPLDRIMVEMRLKQIENDMDYCYKNGCNPEEDEPTFEAYKNLCKCCLEEDEDFRKYVLSEVEKGTEFLDRFGPLKAAVEEYLNGN